MAGGELDTLEGLAAALKGAVDAAGPAAQLALIRAHPDLADRLRAGIVWVNGWALLDSALPFGGVGQSGYGREMGFDAMREYTQVKSVWVNVDAQTPPWYPR